MSDNTPTEPEHHPLPAFAYTNPTPPTPEPEPKGKSKKVTLIVAIAIVAITAVAVGVTVAVSADGSNNNRHAASGVVNTDTRIEAAGKASSCTTTVIEDEGASLSFDTKGEDYADSHNASYTDLYCWLEALDTPSYVIDKMESTNSLAGMVSDDWDGFEASWTYHPDNGMDLTIVDTKAVD